jgi:hypothetical protein
MNIMLMHLFYSLLICLVAIPAWARPEIMHEGISYYSNEYFQEGEVKDIVSEKNYEEVYQFYTYYEVIYESAGRVKVFKEYKQGEVIYEEHYQYDDQGVLIKNNVLTPKVDK